MYESVAERSRCFKSSSLKIKTSSVETCRSIAIFARAAMPSLSTIVHGTIHAHVRGERPTRLCWAFCSTFQSTPTCGAQPGVMPCDGVGQWCAAPAVSLERKRRSNTCMGCMDRTIMQTALEGLLVFTEVVPKAGQVAPLAGTKALGKLLGKRGNIVQVFNQRFPFRFCPGDAVWRLQRMRVEVARQVCPPLIGQMYRYQQYAARTRILPKSCRIIAMTGGYSATE
jgi:hypothetical protein